MSMHVRPRPWDSTFFGVPIFEAQFRGDAVGEVAAEAARLGAECLYLFVDAGDLLAIETAVRAGARLVDLRVELKGRLVTGDRDDLPSTRRATPADRAALVIQARDLAGESRFARDDRIPDERVHDMYEIWLDRCLREGVVAVPAGRPAGFVGARDDDGVVRIELVYVDASARGQGLGRALIREAVEAFPGSEVTVVTQTGNIAAQRLYQSLGLRSRSTIAVLHLWLGERSA